MKGSLRRRVLVALTTAALVVGLVPLAGAGIAGACEDEEMLSLSVEARAYDGLDGNRYLDGVVTNNTSVTVSPSKVKISFAENPGNTCDEWIGVGSLAPGAWATFHLDWPCSTPETWTPSAVEVLGTADDSDVRLPLTLTDVSAPTTDTDGLRSYTVTVTNPNAFPVGDVRVNGREDIAGGDFLDAVYQCCPPDIGAGQSVDFDVVGLSPAAAPLDDPTIQVTGLELPTVTLSADTLRPVYGSPVTFTIEARHHDGSLATGDRILKLYSSPDGDDWSYRYFNTTTGRVVVTAWPDQPTYYMARHYGPNNGLADAYSDELLVTPRVADAAPLAPAKVTVRHAFKVKGRLSAGAKSAGKPIKISAERRSGSHWVKVGTYKPTTDLKGNYYKSLKLKRTGKYRIRAYRAGVGYTPYRSLRVTW
jgi:hypothetical protein